MFNNDLTNFHTILVHPESDTLNMVPTGAFSVLTDCKVFGVFPLTTHNGGNIDPSAFPQHSNVMVSLFPLVLHCRYFEPVLKIAEKYYQHFDIHKYLVIQCYFDVYNHDSW